MNLSIDCHIILHEVVVCSTINTEFAFSHLWFSRLELIEGRRQSHVMLQLFYATIQRDMISEWP